MKKIAIGFLLAVGTATVLGGEILSLGIIDVAADTPHSPSVFRLIEWTRERAIQRRAAEIAPPADLVNAESVRRGAGNYAAMCADCHLAPGIENSEIRQGLYPTPPALTRASTGNTGVAVPQARLFWVIKHGIKASGMPAWSKGSMDDAAIWEVVAFLQHLPSLSPEQYRELVAAGDGQSHGERDAHLEPPNADADSQASSQPSTPKSQAKAHSHAHPQGAYKH